MSEKIKNLVENYNKKLKILQNEIKDEILFYTTEMFEKNEFITAIWWTQYTPGFNDGDPCTFRVSGFYFKTTDFEDDDDGDGISYYSYNSTDKNKATILSQIEKTMELIPSDI